MDRSYKVINIRNLKINLLVYGTSTKDLAPVFLNCMIREEIEIIEIFSK